MEGWETRDYPNKYVAVLTFAVLLLLYFFSLWRFELGVPAEASVREHRGKNSVLKSGTGFV